MCGKTISECVNCSMTVCKEDTKQIGSGNYIREKSILRKQNIVNLYYTGYSKKDIAEMMLCTIRTVETTIKKIHDAKKGGGEK